MNGIHQAAQFIRHALSRPVPFSQKVSSLGRFAFRQAHKRLTGRPLAFRWEDLVLEVPPDASSAAAAFYFGRHDLWELGFLERFLRPGNRAVDVGANVGVYTLFMAKQVGPRGRIYACEPDPGNQAKLFHNIEANRLSQVEVVASAIGSSKGVVSFQMGLDTIGHIVEDGAGTQVPLTTLDLVCGSADPVFIKVDVEGGELDVLRGASRMLERGRPLVWQLELLHQYRQTRNKEILALLQEHGYRLVRYEQKTGRLDPVNAEEAEGNNFLAVRDVEIVAERIRLSTAA